MLSLQEFLGIAISAVEAGRYLFRGQGEIAWTLTPGLFRGSEGRLGIHERISLCEEFYGNHLPKFDRYMKNEEPKWSVEKLDYRVGLAQHAGMRTPLLDWSFSPFVALFFALMDWQSWKDETHSVRVVRVDLNFVPEEVECHHWSKVLPFDRVRAQQGTFVTVNGDDSETDGGDGKRSFPVKCLDELYNADEFLTNFDIELSRNDTIHAFGILDRCNITAGTMFPESIDRRVWVLQNRLQLESL